MSVLLVLTLFHGLPARVGREGHLGCCSTRIVPQYDLRVPAAAHHASIYIYIVIYCPLQAQLPRGACGASGAQNRQSTAHLVQQQADVLDPGNK